MSSSSSSVVTKSPVPAVLDHADLEVALSRRLVVRDTLVDRNPPKVKKGESEADYASRLAIWKGKIAASAARDAEALHKAGIEADPDILAEVKESSVLVQTVKVGKIAIRANSRAGLALRLLGAAAVASKV